MRQIAGLNVEHRRVVPWQIPRAVFHIPLPRRSPVFISVPPCEDRDTSRSIVVVNAQAFLKAWRVDPNNLHADLACGDPSAWPKDRKFDDAADGFRHGIENPVPVAEVSSCELLAESSCFHGLAYSLAHHTRNRVSAF